MGSDWDEAAGGWDSDEHVRAYSDACFDSLKKMCEEQGISLQGSRVIDFGCGTGLLTEKLAKEACHVVAIDDSPKMIQVLQTKKKERKEDFRDVVLLMEHVEAHSFETIETLRQPFDLVLCSSVCGFLKNYAEVAALLFKALKPGGWFLQWDWEESTQSEEEAYGLSRVEVRRVLEGVGFADVRVETAFEVICGAETMKPIVGVGHKKIF